MNKAKTVCIIGAGPGGLAAAMQLAHAGLRVIVLESLDRVGGRCGSIRAEGFRFDIGPTFFLYPRVLAEIFQSVGLDLFQEIPMRRLDPQYRITFGSGGRLDCTPDLSEMDRQIGELSPRDRGALRRYMDRNRVKLERFRPILESPFEKLTDLMRPSVLAAAPHLAPWRSLAGELETYFHDPRLAIAFSFQAKYLGMSPFRCPSLFSILSFLEYEFGVFHPIGGCGEVSERMAKLATSFGAQIRLNEPVESIEFAGKRIRSIRTKAGSIDCDAIVVNADFAASMKKLVPNALRSKWNDAKIDRTKFSCSTYMMYLGVRGQFEDLAHHNIHISSDYERNLREIEIDGVLPSDPSFYVCNPTITDESMAPAGKSSLYVLVPVPNLKVGRDWSVEEQAAFRSRVFQGFEQIGLTNLIDRIEYEKILTPMDWRSDFHIHAGATFNMAHSLDQMLHRRPHNRYEDLEGVYLVGGGTHPGSGLPVIYESSRITCQQLLSDLGVESRFLTEHRGKLLGKPC